MASATALAVSGRGQGSTSLVRRRAWSFAALAVGVGAAIAIASVFATLVIAGAIAVLIYAERPGARDRRALNARRRRRAQRLLYVHIPTDELDELTAIVDTAVRADATVDAADLEELLDRYAETAVARDRCAEVVRREAITELARRHDHARRIAQRRRKRAIARRIAWWHRCEARLVALDEQLADIADLIRIYADRATAPALDFLLEADAVTPLLERLDACE